jgi:hypothetical protein
MTTGPRIPLRKVTRIPVSTEEQPIVVVDAVRATTLDKATGNIEGTGSIE